MTGLFFLCFVAQLSRKPRLEDYEHVPPDYHFRHLVFSIGLGVVRGAEQLQRRVEIPTLRLPSRQARGIFPGRRDLRHGTSEYHPKQGTTAQLNRRLPFSHHAAGSFVYQTHGNRGETVKNDSPPFPAKIINAFGWAHHRSKSQSGDFSHTLLVPRTRPRTRTRLGHRLLGKPPVNKHPYAARYLRFIGTK